MELTIFKYSKIKDSVKKRKSRSALDKGEGLAGGPADVLGVRAGEINVVQSEGNAKAEADKQGYCED